ECAAVIVFILIAVVPDLGIILLIGVFCACFRVFIVVIHVVFTVQDFLTHAVCIICSEVYVLLPFNENGGICKEIVFAVDVLGQHFPAPMLECRVPITLWDIFIHVFQNATLCP